MHRFLPFSWKQNFLWFSPSLNLSFGGRTTQSSNHVGKYSYYIATSRLIRSDRAKSLIIN